jgi:hypothetical protein
MMQDSTSSVGADIVVTFDNLQPMPTPLNPIANPMYFSHGWGDM